MSGQNTPASVHLHYQDADLLVVEKPAGLLCVPGRGADKQDCLSTRVQAIFPDALVVHRLDMATSGLLLMARNLPAQQNLSRQFELRQVHKHYAALVAGDCRAPDRPANSRGWYTIDLPIQVDWPRRPLRKIDPLTGKPSLTHWRPWGFDAARNATPLLLAPVTGRSHQLRIHLQAIGHPILGDALYAPSPVASASERLLLHALHIQLLHPVHGGTMAFHSVPPFGANWPTSEHLVTDTATGCA